MYNIQGPENLEAIIVFLKVIKGKQQEMLNRVENCTAREEGVGMKQASQWNQSYEQGKWESSCRGRMSKTRGEATPEESRER